MLLLAGTMTIGTSSFASSCRNVSFSNGSACLSISKVSGNTFRLNTDSSNGNSSLRCGILLPDKAYTDVSCNGGIFTTNTLGVQRVKIFVKQGSDTPTTRDSKPSSDSQRLFPQWDYDFSNQDWANSSYYNYNNYNNTYYNGYTSTYNVRNFSITSSMTNPGVGNRVKITVNSLDSNGNILTNYYGSNARISVQYRTSTSSSWISTTSASYYSIDNDSPYFSNGSAYTYITFYNNYDYRITVTDNSSDIYGQQVIYLNGSSSNYNNNNYYGSVSSYSLSLSNSSPSTYSQVRLTLNALDSNGNTLSNYYGSNATISVAYRTSSSNSWINTTSSSSYTIDSNSPYFSNGSAATNITFYNNYDYRITVTDDNSNISTQKIVYLYGSSSNYNNNYYNNINNFSVASDNMYPSTNEQVDLTVKARDSGNYTVSDYRWTVRFSVEKQSGSSWSTASYSYYDLNQTSYTFTSSDYGYHTFNNIIDFNIAGTYRVTAYDSNNSTIYGTKIFTVSSSNYYNNNYSSYNNVSSYGISLSNSTPNVWDRIKLNINALDSNGNTLSNYYGSNATISIAYRTSSSYSWTTISSYSYYSIDSTIPYFSNGSAYTYITFNGNYDYRITVTDSNSNISTQKIVYVNRSSYNNDYNNNYYYWSTYWYTSDQVSTIQTLYNLWNGNISTLRSSSYNLRNDTYRQNMSDNLRSEMGKILNNDNARLYTSYNQFQSAFANWYSYTTSHK